MKLIVRLICIFSFSFCTSYCLGQHVRQMPLKVGDLVPDIEIENVINYKANTLKLSDFNGKLLILDFWATWCSPCLASFRKLDSLQKNYKDILEILPVTYEETKQVDDFLDQLHKIIGLLPASVTADEQLGGYFPYMTVPHYVWIDTKSMRVLAITDGTALNESNILAYQRNQPLTYMLKEENTDKLTYNSSLFLPAFRFKNSDSNFELKQMKEGDLLYQSVLSKFVEGVEGNMWFGDSIVTVTNVPIWRLFQVALFGNSMAVLNNGSMRIEIPNDELRNIVQGYYIDGKKPASGRESLQWLRQYGYSYELKVPYSIRKKKYSIMLSELNNYFGNVMGVEGVVEKRLAKCLALVRTSSVDKITSRGGDRRSDATKIFARIQNNSLQALIVNLSVPLQSYPPIVDETNYSGNADIELRCDLSNLADLNKELAKYDLKFEEKEVVMDIGVIRLRK